MVISPLTFREVILGVVISIQSFVPAAVLQIQDDGRQMLKPALVLGDRSPTSTLVAFTNAGALTISSALRGAKTNSSVLCLLTTLHFSSLALRQIVPAEAAIKL